MQASPWLGRVSVASTVPREDKWLAQTPQMFRLGALHAALADAAQLTGLLRDDLRGSWLAALDDGDDRQDRLAVPLGVREAWRLWIGRLESLAAATGRRAIADAAKRCAR